MIRPAVEFLNFLDSIKQCSCRKIQVSNIFGDIVRNKEKLRVNAILVIYFSQGIWRFVRAWKIDTHVNGTCGVGDLAAQLQYNNV